jgi:hypothetical protein
MLLARSTISRSVPVNALTRRFVTTTSPAVGATAGWTSEPAAKRPLSRMGANDWLRGLTSG